MLLFVFAYCSYDRFVEKFAGIFEGVAFDGLGSRISFILGPSSMYFSLSMPSWW